MIHIKAEAILMVLGAHRNNIWFILEVIILFSSQMIMCDPLIMLTTEHRMI